MALTTNLVAYWKLDESSGNPVDASGNGLTLTNNNTTPFGIGKINNGALLTTAGNRYFSIANASAGALNFTGSMSWSGWINPTSSSTSIQPVFKQNDGVSAQYTLGIGTTGTMFLNLGLGGSFHPYNSTADAGALTGGTWYHIAVVFDFSAKTIAFYFNGSQLGSTITGVDSGSFNNLSDDFLLGGRKATGTTTGNVDGKIDEWAAWNRTLSGAEVALLYNGGAGNQYPFATDVTVTPAVKNATFSTNAPTIVAQQFVTVTPAVKNATFSTNAATFISSYTATPSVQNATFAVPHPAVQTPDATINPSVQNATFSVSDPVIVATQNVVVTPAVQNATFATPDPSITIVQSVTVLPNVLAATFALPKNTISADFWQPNYTQVDSGFGWNNKYN